MIITLFQAIIGALQLFLPLGTQFTLGQVVNPGDYFKNLNYMYVFLIKTMVLKLFKLSAYCNAKRILRHSCVGYEFFFFEVDLE
jgi:hypothetical protein